MSFPFVIFTDCGPAGLEWAKMAGLTEKTVPEKEVTYGSLTMPDPLTTSSFLYSTVPFWPEGTVFLSAPTAYLTKPAADSHAVCVKLQNGSYILSPNDGTATICARLIGVSEVRSVDVTLPWNNGLEDGFALVRLGALLSETLTFESIGPVLPAEELFLFNIAPAKIAEGVAEGQVFMLLKTFGNLTFTIGTDEFENTGIRHGDPVHVTFTKDGKTVWEADTTFQPSFGYVPEGEPVIFNGSSGYLDIGLNKHSFIARCLPQIAEDDPLAYYVRIEKKEAK